MRAFPNEEVIHEEGDIDPIRDIEIINGELIAKDLQGLDKVFEAIKAKMKRKKEKRDEEHLDCMERVKAGLDAGVFVKNGVWSGKDVEFINDQHFLTAKPVVFLVNIGDT